MDPVAAPLGVAAFLALLALLVLLARPGHRLNRLFAALLLLRAASTATYGLVRDAATPDEAMFWGRLTVWYALATPLLLVGILRELFFPRARAGYALALGATGLATAGLAWAHAFVPHALVFNVLRGGRGTWGFGSTTLLDAFTGITLLLEATLAALAVRAARSPHRTALSRSQATLIGLAFAFVPLRQGAFFLTFLAVAPAAFSPGAFALRLAPAILAFALVLACLPPLARELHGWGRRASLALLPLAAGIGALDALAATGRFASIPGHDTGAVLARAAFAGTAALALLRYGLAGLDGPARARLERASRAGLGLAAGALVAGLVLALAGLTTEGLVVAPLVGLAVVLLSPAPLARLAGRGIRLPPDDPRHAQARLAHDAPASDAPPLLGRYRVLRELGRGGSSTVHLAEDALTGATVVVKRFHAAASRGALAEARALAAVRHPRIVPLLDVETVAGEPFLVLGHAPGGTLRERLDRAGPLPAAEALPLALDVLEGLAALHARGLAHGDVKPENVLLDAEGRAVLADLGSARFFALDVTSTGAMGGASLSTAAPEVLRGERATPASDLYALAATLHRLLTGRHYVALEDADAFAARERILLDAPRLPDPRVPPHVEAALRRALAKRPDERFASAEEMMGALRRVSILVHEQAAPRAEDVARP